MWEEETSDKQPTHSERVVDLAFRISCDCLPVDHTSALSDAIGTLLPWFEDEPLAGLHLIHVAGSQNGWMRPEEPDELLHLSRRTRLTIRIPIDRVSDAQQLTEAWLWGPRPDGSHSTIQRLARSGSRLYHWPRRMPNS